MPQTVLDLLNNGIKAGNADRFRSGNVISLPPAGSVVVTGDIHGHRRNFERMVSFADLANNPDRHIVLQEIIHGGPENTGGNCLSYKLLFDTIRYKLSFPDRVHIIMGNHDTAFITGSEIMKNGREMNLSLHMALDNEFKQASADIQKAMSRYLLSQPLAVRTETRIWMSHSLPDDKHADEFDSGIFNRELKPEDVERTGSAYFLTWGKKHSQPVLDKMAKMFDIDTFILGHQTQKQGWSKAGENLIIITSEHNHGCLLPINLEKKYTIEQLTDSIVPLASIA